jgi:TolB protein
VTASATDPATGQATGPGDVSSSAAYSLTQGQLVFTRGGSAAGDHEQVFVERADGSGAHQLLNSDADDTDPVLSPDGRAVVFTRRVSSRPDRIFLVGADGSGLRQMRPSDCPGVCSDAVEGAAWSPDGRTLAFTRTIFRDRGTVPTSIEIWLMDLRTSSAHAVTHGSTEALGGGPGSQDNAGGWAPDGRRLLFTHQDYRARGGVDQFAVMTVNLDGTDQRQLTPNDVNAGQPAWSPDGTLIVFQSPPDDEGVTKNLYTIRLDGTGMTSLTYSLGGGSHSTHPTWSPDGSLIAFSHVPAGSGTPADLYVVERDGSRPRPIAQTRTNEGAPFWGPAPP